MLTWNDTKTVPDTFYMQMAEIIELKTQINCFNLSFFNIDFVSVKWFGAIGSSARSRVNQNSKKKK